MFLARAAGPAVSRHERTIDALAFRHHRNVTFLKHANGVRERRAVE
jgi:hypothetical protein